MDILVIYAEHLSVPYGERYYPSIRGTFLFDKKKKDITEVDLDAAMALYQHTIGKLYEDWYRKNIVDDRPILNDDYYSQFMKMNDLFLVNSHLDSEEAFIMDKFNLTKVDNIVYKIKSQ